jgi:uncharacterized protein (TIGR02145 family)
MINILNIVKSLVLAVIISLLFVGCGGDDPTGPNNKIPVLTTADVTEITASTAHCGGTISLDGGAPITARGICWSTNPIPTIADNKTLNGTGMESYTSLINGMIHGTPYYARAYATNRAGTAYGNTMTFTTLIVTPSVTTIYISAITQTSVQSGGVITSDGGEAVTARGVCWSTNPTPTIADNITLDGTGTGIYTSSIVDLTGNTSYYVRAYATNSIGTAYGRIKAFTTLLILPELTTAPVSEITTTSAQCGGTIISDGGAAITARGVCWSTNPTPTVADNKTSDGIGTGSFASSIVDLSGNTPYYVRAYATNSIGTSYGNTREFITSPILPEVATDTVSEITTASAQCGGTIISDGGAAITARGVCWSTNPIPTINDNISSNGTGVGSFISIIAGLTHVTSYYVRAYATNSVGTSYGNIMIFATIGNETGNVTDIEGNIYQTVRIGTQWWMAENLKVTHYRNGDAIPRVTTPYAWSILNTGAYCEYNNDTNYAAIYGRLYNWYAVSDSRNIAPAGWHVASESEWKQLDIYLGISPTDVDKLGFRGTDEGGKMKEIGTTYWDYPNSGATNESGFSARPGGMISDDYLVDEPYMDMRILASFWTSSTVSIGSWAWSRFLTFDDSRIGRTGADRRSGFSVRCVKD